MTCTYCDEAKKRPHVGMYNSWCRSCKARALCQSPTFHEAIQSNTITPAYRHALQVYWGEQWKAGHEETKAWASILEALKNPTNGSEIG